MRLRNSQSNKLYTVPNYDVPNYDQGSYFSAYGAPAWGMDHPVKPGDDSVGGVMTTQGVVLHHGGIAALHTYSNKNFVIN